MVVTTGEQLTGTWLTWKSFYYPDSSGSKWAYAVPTKVANQINSGYGLIIDLLISEFWVLIISFIISIFLHKKRVTNTAFKDLMPDVWNGKDDFRGVVMDKISYVCGLEDAGHAIKLSVVLFCLFALYCGQKAVSILVSSKVIIGTVAPVNPDAIYYPVSTDLTGNGLTKAYILNAPWAFRAFGTATASIDSLGASVSVSDEISLGTFNGTEQVSQVNYNYNVTGADMGLQKYPDLTLSVNGSCFTEYNWYISYDTLTDIPCLAADFYYWFDNASLQQSVSALDGLAPMAFFKRGESELPGALPTSNTTWAAIISSIGKISYTAGTDAWYLTDVLDASDTSTTEAGYYVTQGRPALSCWEDNVWSYGGQTAPITNLSSLPGLGLSTGMQNLLTNSLAVPMVLTMSIYLGSSALASGSSISLGTTIDAGANNYAQDLQRLIVAAYVATTNVLTTTTLYPEGASATLDNDVLDSSGQLQDGVADFVVWTSSATALNLAVIISIPVLLVGLFLLNYLLLRLTAMGKADLLSAPELFKQLIEKHNDANIIFSSEEKAKWDIPDKQCDNTGTSQSGKPAGESTTSPA